MWCDKLHGKQGAVNNVVNCEAVSYMENVKR